MSTEAAAESALERSWWLRAPAVLVAPQAVFVALRDDSEEATQARQEPVMLIAGLAGIAGVLATSTFRRALNDGSVTMTLVAVLAFIAGSLYALSFYWVGGGLLYRASRRLGSEGAHRRPRGARLDDRARPGGRRARVGTPRARGAGSDCLEALTQ